MFTKTSLHGTTLEPSCSVQTMPLFWISPQSTKDSPLSDGRRLNSTWHRIRWTFLLGSKLHNQPNDCSNKPACSQRYGAPCRCKTYFDVKHTFIKYVLIVIFGFLLSCLYVVNSQIWNTAPILHFELLSLYSALSLCNGREKARI